MNGLHAAEYVRNLAFKPGWEVTAEWYGGYAVLLGFLIDTVDTSYPDADGVCRRKIKIYGVDKMLDTEHMERADLCYEVLKLAAVQDSHENREFLQERQPDGTWKAPLHPHTRTGNAAWDQREQSGSQPQRQPAALGATGLMQLLGLED